MVRRKMIVHHCLVRSIAYIFADQLVRRGEMACFDGLGFLRPISITYLIYLQIRM
jgi:hypothetical protein